MLLSIFVTNREKNSMTTATATPQAKQTAQPLYLYNSLSKQKTMFTPIEAGKIGLYVCGMTVYDYCHIGHARVMIAFDVLVRWLRNLGYEVNYVRNITDIDDKIIKRANENDEDIHALTSRFIAAMHQDADQLGCLRPDSEPKATEHIDNMQNMISTLVANQHAYAASNGDVYYRVESFADYGKLSGRKLADMQAGASDRLDATSSQQKQHPFDFVLWKAAKPNEPHWQSPWGIGRPGWHIECSAMSTCCLGHTFDIHGGGHDLQFPHHENEIAQSEGATGKPYVNTWMHVGFVNVDGEKMSKSLGNFFTIRDVMQQFNAETIRFFMIASHYRSPINFSDAALKEAHAGLSRLYQALKVANIGETQSFCLPNNTHTQTFYAAMNDDINTAGAVSVLFTLAREVNKAAKADDVTRAQTLACQLRSLGKVLNILQDDPQAFLQQRVGEAVAGLTDAHIESKIAQRAAAKKAKNFALADAIRDELKQAGVELEDSREGTTWRWL